MERLTTDKPVTTSETALNYAYVLDKDIYLRYADGEENIKLAEYIARLSREKCGGNTTENDILNGACSECDCEICILNTVAIQAAEMRNALKEYEDAEEDGRLLVLPCKVGDTVYYIEHDTAHNTTKIKSGTVWQFGYEDYLWLSVSVSKNKVVVLKSDLIYTTQEAAEQALKEREQ